MKCPNCSHNQQYRSGMCCNKCRYQFVFNPKDSNTFKVTDGKVISAIRKASAVDTQYFTANQLYSVMLSRLSHSSVPGLIVGFLFCGLAIIAHQFGAPLFVALVATIVYAGIFYAAAKNGFRFNRIPRHIFDTILSKWQRSELASQHLLENLSLSEPPPQYTEPDIYDYGVERILIVDNPLLVDLLVANDWHAENAALVVSIQQYPAYIWERADRLLRENPALPVFALHASDSTGCGLLSDFREHYPELVGSRRLFDLGLSPGNAQKLGPINYSERTWILPP